MTMSRLKAALLIFAMTQCAASGALAQIGQSQPIHGNTPPAPAPDHGIITPAPPPPRPPPPPPPPGVSTSYVVFFGSKSSAISAEARGVLKQAADNVTTTAAGAAEYRKDMIDYETMLTFDGKTPALPPEVDQIVAAHTAKVSVVGYDDASGTKAVALRVSERRAKAAAAALVGLGVPRAAISVSWKGKSDPAVPTANGVREAQNRRVSVDVTY